MPLKDFCTEENFIWKTDYARAFRAETENGEIRTVLRYQIPFPQEDEMLFMERFQLPATRRLQFYQNLLRCIQQQIKTSALLAQSGVPSIIRFSKVENERDESGTTSIYLETEEIWPIRSRLLASDVDRATAINMIYRLSIILREVAKEPHSVVLRGLDMNEVFLNGSGKIILGGLFYASSPHLPPYPDYLPGSPRNLTDDVARGGAGTPGSDMYSLSCIAWNLFSGVPVDAGLPDHIKNYPQYGTDALAEVLFLGRQGNDADLAAFRRRLSDCRKQICKDPESQMRFPVPEQRRYLHEIDYV